MTAAPSDRRAIITEALRKIDDLTARLEIAEKGDTEPIAVVGMGCRLPGGADTPDQFWRLLQDGGNGIVGVPSGRWDADAFYSDDHSVPGTIVSKEGGFLTSWRPDEFDAEFFGISPREAAAMDPQQRLLLEVTWEALENAGITAPMIRGTQTSVFVGMTTYDYTLTLAGRLPPEEVDPHVPFGNAANFAAGRLSYFLGAHGPAVVLDTACSSSLVTVHLACQSLRRRESDQALVAGVNLMLSPENSVATSRWGMLAPDGRCKTFDASADGYVRSEGCGVVVLKRLSDAVRDGDSVLAVVRGSAVNQDGPSSGQTVPSGPAQQAVVRSALAAARLEPSDIDYIEAHGTGTALGDPIELGALHQVFGERHGAAPLVLGSVKTNLGHLESAAGIAGFIKTVLTVQHGYIPQHLHFTELTPNAVEGASKFTIAADGMDWPAVGRARRAGVSSFGVSGTNAHVVIEQAPAPEPVAPQPEPVITTLVVSGKSPARIASTAQTLADWMIGEGAAVSLTDVAHTLNHHRTHHKTFATVSARDRAHAVAGLQALAAGQSAIGLVGPHEGLCKPGTVFVYSGQGSQWAGMGRQLLTDEPAFAAAVEELEPLFARAHGVLPAASADRGPAGDRRRPRPAGADGPAVGVDRVVAFIRCGTRCGDWTFDGRGDRGRGGRGADPRRGPAGHRDPFTADVEAGRPRRGRSAGDGRRCGRKAARRLPRGEPGRLPVAAANRDRRRGGTGRRGDQCRERTGAFRAAGEYGSRLAHRADGSHPARITFGASRSDAQAADDSVYLHRRRRDRDAGPGRRLLGCQRASAGAAAPGHQRRRRATRHVHRNQPAPHADARRHRNAGVGAPSQRWDVVARGR